jgi:hypothetical protein
VIISGGQLAVVGDRRGYGWLSKSAKELRVYQQAYALAMEIFDLSKAWPKE